MKFNRWNVGGLILVMALLAASCSGSDAEEASEPSPEPAAEDQPPAEEQPPDAVLVSAVEVPERAVSEADTSVAGRAISEFGNDLFTEARTAAPSENLSLSPASVAIALAMLEPGTSGEAQTQIRELLRISDPGAFHASMNGLEQELEARVPDDFGPDADPGELEMRIANAAYLQQGYPFESTYLETIGSNYGPVLNEVDFPLDPDAVGDEINKFIADATNDRITDLVAPGAISRDTVLALVNALYMNASWLSPFPKEATEDKAFTQLDGTPVEVPMMTTTGDSSSQGNGWVGATKVLTGRLRVQFILPDEGRFDEIADNLGAVWDEWPALSSGGGQLDVPRFETRSTVQLDATLQALGLTAPYAEGNLLGIAPDERLAVDKVLHETFVAVDEDGIEAAAATVVLVIARSAPANRPVPVILDRPFLYRIVDDVSGATLFIGQILDPLT